MTVLELQEAMRRTGAYTTPPASRRRPLPVAIATPLFHLRLLGIILGGYVRAGRSGFEAREWGNFCFRMHRLTELLGGTVTFSGFQNVHDVKFPVVWVANHVSSLETYLLPQILTAYSNLSVILKESLARYPFFGRVVRNVRPIRVTRASPVEDLRRVLTAGVAMLQEGRSVLVFPEGHRMARFDPAAFNSMGVKLAQRAGVPVVPLAVKADFMKLGWPWKDLGTIHPRKPIHIACGPVLGPGMSPRDCQEASTRFIATQLAEWERECGTPLLAAPDCATKVAPT